jgi:hypothetical protein
MKDFILLMHNDSPPDAVRRDTWPAYFAKLEQSGLFEGGSTIGDGVCVSKSATPPPITHVLAGYIRIRAESLSAARELVAGNPVFEAGGTVEIRELPRNP